MKKIIAIVLICLLPLNATASMQDMLNNMFLSNTTNPQSFRTQNRAGYVGGSVELRAPIKPITLAAFDPPRFNAGCGGLDAYGGSFSFIDAQQFTALIRHIMAGAIGLMFQAALKAINPMIADLTNYFQKLVNDLNRLASNTCAIAHQIPGLEDPNSKTNSAATDWARLKSDFGGSPDFFSGAHPGSRTESKTNAVTSESGSDSAVPINPSVGNLVWRGLQRTSAFDKLDFPAGSTVAGVSDNDFKAEILMSMIGTEIVSTAKAQANEDHAPEVRPRVLKISQLVNEMNSATPLTFYACQAAPAGSDLANTGGPGAQQFGGQGCPVVSELTLPFSGTRPYVLNMLYGDPDASEPGQIVANASTYAYDSPHPASIFAKLQAGTAGTLTPAQIFPEIHAWFPAHHHH